MISQVEQFVMDQLGYDRDFGPCAYMGFGEPLVAGVIYHNWHPESGVIELSAASSHRRWLTRSRLFDIFAYPFIQLQCRICVARISEHNKRTRKIWRSLGATEYVIPELRAPNEAEVISVLTADAWKSSKFVKGAVYGKTPPARAA